MSEPIINRIYDLKISGYDDVMAKVQSLTDAFKSMDETKKLLNQQLQQKISSGDADAVTQLTQKIKDLETEMAKLKTQRDSAAKEQALLAKAEKDQADALLKTQKATESIAKTELLRTTNVIAQEKELDRQIALEDQQAAKLLKEKEAVDALEGSYNNLKSQRVALQNLVANATPGSQINFQNNTLSYDEAIAKIKEIKIQEQAFTDQLRVEKSVHNEITDAQQGSITAITKERTELEALVKSTTLGSSVNFQGQTLQYDEAISKIKELKQQEQQFTDSIRNEKSITDEQKKSVDALEGSYTALKNQRLELEKLTANANSSSTITFQGNTFSYDEAISKIKEIKAQEQTYLEQLKIEKQSQASIISEIQDKITATKIERLELEKVISTANQSNNISSNGQTLNLDQAIAKVNELNTLETEYTQKLNTENEVHQNIIRSQQESITASQKQISELQELSKNNIQNSSLDFNGQSFTQDEALAKIKDLQEQERIYTEQLNQERATQEQINAEQLAKIESLKLERQELESVVQAEQQNTSVNVKGQTFNYTDAIDQIRTLQVEEINLNTQLDEQGVEVKNLGDNYYGLLAKQKEAINLYRNVTFDSPIFEEVKQQAIEASNAVQNFNRTLTPDGTLVGEYKTGIINAFKNLGLDDVLREQRQKLQVEFDQLKEQSENLAKDYRTAGSAGTAAFKDIEQQLIINVQEQERVRQSLTNLDNALKNTGNVGTGISTSIAEGFKNMRSQLSQLLVGYVGFQAVFQGAISLVQTNETLSDSFADLKIRIHGTSADVDNLFESLKKIDTRTSLTGLVDIASIVAKKGVDKDSIAGITQELDKLFVVLGKEAGDPKEATASIVKLISIFSDDKHVTAERVDEIGTALFKLTTSGVATGSFLIDFAERVGAVRGITGLTLPSILGMGAALQQLGQRTETAGTAAVQLATKMFGNVPKFAEAAGQSVEQFKKLLEKSPFDALVAVAENLKNSGKDFEDVTTAFGEVGITGARVKAVLADIATNGEFVKQKMAAASVTTADYANQSAAATAKQTTFAATLDKITKQFEILGTNKTVQALLTGIASTIILLLSNLPTLLTIMGVLGVSWAFQNSELILLNAQLLYYNLNIGLNYIALGILSVAQLAYNGILLVTTTVTRAATAALEFFGITIKGIGGPLGIILTLVGLLGVAYEAFGRKLDNTISSLNSQNRLLKANMDVMKQANIAAQEQIGKIDLLTKVVENNNISLDTRKKALEQLIAINPAFSAALDGEKIRVDKLTEAYKGVIEQIRAKAAADASASLSTEKQKNVLTITSLRQRVETEFAQQGGDQVGFQPGDLPDDEEAILKRLQSVETTRNLNLSTTESFAKKDFGKVVSELKQLENNAIDVYTDYLKVQTQKSKELAEIQAKFTDTTDQSAGIAKQKFEVDIAGLKEQIKQLDEQIDNFKGSQADLTKLIVQRKTLQTELDNLLEKTKTTKGSQLTGADKDIFKDIDAQRDQQLASEKLKFAELQEDEETYLRNVLKINEDAANKKISLLNDSNAEERKVISEQRLYIIDQQEETNKKLFDLEKKKLDDQLASIVSQSKISIQDTKDDPTKTDTQKAQTEQSILDAEYIAQFIYNEKVDQLEKQFNQNSYENAQKRKDALLLIASEIQKNELDIFKATLTDIQDASDRNVNAIKQSTVDKTTNILNDGNISTNRKSILINQVDIEEQKKLLAEEVDADQKALDAQEKALKDGLTTETAVSDAKTKLKLAELALLKYVSDQEKTYLDKLQDSLNNAYHNITDFFTGVKKTNAELKKELGDALQAAASTISTAITKAEQDYFSSQSQQIDKEKTVATERLSIQEQQAENLSQSQAQTATIQRKFAAEQAQIDLDAANKKKKLALEEAAIDFGVAVIKTLAAYPFPFSLIPIAALTVAYELQRANIEKQQFAKGGQVQPQQVGNGLIRAKPNIPTQSNGDNILATVRVNEVILNEEQQRKAGGAPFFNSIGVPGFDGGGKVENNNVYNYSNVRAFADGGFTGIGSDALGGSLQAPVNPQSFVSSSGNIQGLQNILEAIDRQTKNLNAVSRQTNSRIDKLQVVLDPNAVKKANDKNKKATAIGRL